MVKMEKKNAQLIYKENDTIKCYDKCKEGQFIYEIGTEKYCIGCKQGKDCKKDFEKTEGNV